MLVIIRLFNQILKINLAGLFRFTQKENLFLMLQLYISLDQQKQILNESLKIVRNK